MADYWVLTRWLLSHAIRLHHFRLPAGLVFSISSVAMEMLAFFLIVHVLQELEITSAIPSNQASTGYLAGLPFFAVISLPAFAFVAAGVLTYLGRSNSIEVQGSVARHLSDAVLEKLSSRLSFFDRLRLPPGLDETEILQVALNDTAACGTAVRLIMLHFISIVYLIVGLAILAVLAPPLLLLWLGALVVIVPAIYLINLRALREARDLGDIGPQYRRSLTRYVRFLIDAKQPAMEVEQELRRRYLSILSGRLRIVEISRLTLSIVFAIAITVFLLIVRNPEMRSLISIGYLLFLFLAFRYTYQGVQGLSVLVTTINRNLPSMIRTHKILQRLDKLATAAGSAGQAAENEALPQLARIMWSLDRNGEQVQGVFEPGRSYGLVVPAFDKIATIGQIYHMVASRAGKTQFARGAGAEPDLVRFNVARGAIENASDREWVRRIVLLERPNATPQEVDNAVDGRSDGTLGLSATIAMQALIIGQSPPRILVIDGNALSNLRFRTQRAILEKLRSHLVFSFTNRLGHHLQNHAYDSLLISSGKSVAMVLPSTEQVTDDLREQARKVYDSDRVRSTAAGVQLDDDFDDIAGSG